MGLFFEKAIQNRAICLMKYVLYSFMTWLPYLLFKLPVLIIVMNVVGLFCITGNYTKAIKKRVISTMFIYLLLACIEILVVLFSGYKELELLKQSGYESLFGQICIMAVLFMVTLLLECFGGIRKADNFPHSYGVCIFIVPISSILLIFKMLNAKNPSISGIAINIVVLLMINYAVFCLYDALARQLSLNIESECLRKQNEFYQKQFDLMKASEQSVRLTKHDLNNHLGTVRRLAGQTEHNEVISYIDQLLANTTENQEYVDTGNIVLNSLLNFKISEAIQKNINVETKIKIPNVMDIEIYDLTIILGNLLDNAFEAVSSLPIREREINLKMEYDRGRLFIEIKNRFLGKLKYGENKHTLKTTKKDVKNHGNGLINIKKSVQHYYGTFDIEIEEENNVFGVFIMLYTNMAAGIKKAGV